MNGKIGHVAMDRGFGFIVGEDGQDYFMHRSALTDCLNSCGQARRSPSMPARGPRANAQRTCGSCRMTSVPPFGHR